MKIILRCMTLLVSLSLMAGCMTPSPLNTAAINNDVESIRTLIQSGADIEAHSCSQFVKGKLTYTTPLCVAVMGGNYEAAEALIKHGADVNCMTYVIVPTTNSFYGFKGTPLMVAAANGNAKITELLLKAGAETNTRSKRNPNAGIDAMCWAAINGNVDTGKILIEHGVDPNNRYADSIPAVYYALENQNLDFIALLLTNEVEPELDEKYPRHVAEFSHMAGDFYAPTARTKALKFYKQALEYYPKAINNAETMVDWEETKETLGQVLSLTQTIAGQVAYSKTGDTQFLTYDNNSYDLSNLPKKQRWQAKEERFQAGHILCKSIVDYAESNPNKPLVECIESVMHDIKAGSELK